MVAKENTIFKDEEIDLNTLSSLDDPLSFASRLLLVRPGAYAAPTQARSSLNHHFVAVTINHTLILRLENAYPQSAPIHACISLC